MGQVAVLEASHLMVDIDRSSGWSSWTRRDSFDLPLEAPNVSMDAPYARGHGHRPNLRWNPHFLVKRSLGVDGLETGGERVVDATPPASNVVGVEFV